MDTELFTEEELAGLTPKERQALAPEQEITATPPRQSTEESGLPGFTFSPEYRGPSMQEIDKIAGDLDRQLEEGDIDIIEYNKRRDPLVQQRVEARMSQNLHDSRWRQERDQFFTHNREYRDDPVLSGALQRVFASLDTPENSHRSGLELLEEAKRQVDASARRIAEARKMRADVQKASQGKKGSDHAYLDSLEGRQYEDALAGLTDEETARYLQE